MLAVLVAFVFIALATLRWDAWTGNAVTQTTNDAYVRAEMTRLSSRVAGEVLTVATNDFQRVKAGDLLIQIDKVQPIMRSQASADRRLACAGRADDKEIARGIHT